MLAHDAVVLSRPPGDDSMNDDDRERRRHDLIVTIRYAVLVPIMVLFLVATYWKKFNGPPKQSYYLVQSLCVPMCALLVGCPPPRHSR